MILKDIDPKRSSELKDPKQKWGYEAEQKMSFYLKRAFGSDPNVFVINDLRVVHGEDVAQIDHLILLRYGIVIVESKSVTTEVEVNEHGEWSRKTQWGWKGMPSPLLQGKRQYEVLARVLEEIKELKPMLGSRRHWINQPFVTIAAISDNGRINRPKNHPLDDVMKAERVPEVVPEIDKRFEKAFNAKLFGGPIWLLPETLATIGSGLIERHVPRHSTGQTKLANALDAIPVEQPDVQADMASRPPAPVEVIPAATEKVSTDRPSPCCKHCGETERLEIRFGRGYYTHCLACGKNTAIDVRCESASCSRRLRKSKTEFFVECDACQQSFHYHVNATT